MQPDIRSASAHAVQPSDYADPTHPEYGPVPVRLPKGNPKLKIRSSCFVSTVERSSISRAYNREHSLGKIDI